MKEARSIQYDYAKKTKTIERDKTNLILASSAAVLQQLAKSIGYSFLMM